MVPLVTCQPMTVLGTVFDTVNVEGVPLQTTLLPSTCAAVSAGTPTTVTNFVLFPQELPAVATISYWPALVKLGVYVSPT